jgi:chemotaxis protein CheZ
MRAFNGWAPPMPVQRKVFRIEELGHKPPRSGASAGEAESALRHNEIMTELKLLRALFMLRGTDGEPSAPPTSAVDALAFKGEVGAIYEAIRRTKQEIATLHVTGFNPEEMARLTQELGAVVGGSEHATHRILQAGEEIEEIASTLSAALKNLQDRDLARDIQDHVTRIFEACNFQDLAGQRVTKVIATLRFIEDHIIRMMDIWGGVEQFKDIEPEARAEVQSHPKLINGPRLDDDRGYVSQKEIDAMFAVARAG